MGGESRREAASTAEGRGDLSRIAGEISRQQRVRGQAGAADRWPDTLAGHVAREPRGVADEGEPHATHDPRPVAADRIRVTAERRQLEPGGQAAALAELREQALETAPHGQAPEGADADVQEVTLREVPAVALEVRLGDELRRTVVWGEAAQQLGADARLALLGHDDVLVVAHAA